MSKFIEVTETSGKKVFINVSHIFMVEPNEKGCSINLIPTGFNSYPFQIVRTSLSCDEIISLIRQSE